VDWFATAPASRALLIGVGGFLAILLGLWPLLRGADGLDRRAVLALASVPAGLLSAGLLALSGLVGLLHPWPPLPAAACGLGPVALLLVVGLGIPTIRERLGGSPAHQLPPPPLPDKPGRLPPSEEETP